MENARGAKAAADANIAALFMNERLFIIFTFRFSYKFASSRPQWMRPPQIMGESLV